jgi:hypothetical protein
MVYHTAERTTQGTRAIGDIVRAASRLADLDEIRSVHVISGERPTYDDLLQVRESAVRRNIDLTVGGSSISFRRRLHAEPSVEPSRRVSSVLDWLRVHWHAWSASLGTLSEGTR